jgi:Flp pilus assembly protein TadG
VNHTTKYWRLAARRQQRGAVILEAAFVFPILLLLVLGGLDLSLLARARSNVDYITQKSADCSAKQGCDPVALATANAQGLAMPGQLTVTVNQPGDVTVTYSWAPIGPFISATTLQSEAKAVAQ